MMLANPLPPIRFEPFHDSCALMQYFALCYLAKYTSAPLPSRTVQAFQNAYGVIWLQQIPAVSGGQPGAIACAIQYPWGIHLVVAVEGITSVSQLYSLFVAPGDMVYVTNPIGYVMANAQNYGTNILAALLTVPQFATYYNAPTTKVSFTGYSLGAAIAEYMAFKAAFLNPNERFRLLKFAAPRVATATWYRNIPNNLDAHSVYHWGDHIHMLPASGMAYSSASAFAVPTGVIPYALDPSASRYLSFDAGMRTVAPANIIDRTNFVAAFLRGPVQPGTLRNQLFDGPVMVGADSVYYHGMNSMRLMWNTRARFADDMSQWRFNYLEFPDENQWQVLWQPGNVWQPAWMTSVSPGPIGVTPDGMEQAVRLHNAVPEPVRPPQNFIQPGLPGGNLNVVDPLIQGGRRRNRHNPAGT